jgi:ribonuclease HI
MAATNRIISIVIVVERKEEAQEYAIQRPVYYISKVLTESKQCHPHYQKLAYGVFLASRKLQHYFYDHKITVVSKAPLKDIINNNDAIGRVAKWGIKLASFDIDYKPRTAIKSQALVEFMADWKEAQETTPVPELEHWVMHFDGSKLLHGSGARVTLKSPKGDELNYVLQIYFPTTNNIAEYEALLHGLCVTKEIGVHHIMCCGDSDLVAQQVAGTYKARNKVMAAYRDEVDEMAKSFLGYDIKHIRREDNMAANTLPKLGSSRKAVLPGVFLEHLHVPLVKMVDPENLELASSPVMAVLPCNPPWAEPYLEDLTRKKLPEDEVQKR